MSNPTIIGRRDCPISQIVFILKSSPIFSVFHENWTSIARSIDTPSYQIKKLRQDMLLDKIGLADTIQLLIEDWVGRINAGATLQEFIQILESNGMRSCADSLKSEFLGQNQKRESKPNPNHPTIYGESWKATPTVSNKVSNLPAANRGNSVEVEEFRVAKIVNILRKSQSFLQIRTKWSDIASALETPHLNIETLRQDLILNKITLADVLYSLLEEWVARIGSRANVTELIRLLEDNYLHNFADDLKEGLGMAKYNNLGLNNIQNADGNMDYFSSAFFLNGDKRTEQLVVRKANINIGLQASLHKAARQARDIKSVDLNIIKSLIESGADVFAKDEENRTFIHVLLEKDSVLSQPQLTELIEYLVQRNYSMLFEMPGWKTEATPFHWAVLELEVEESSLSLLHSSGVDFTVVDKLGRSILFYGVAGERSLKFLFSLIRFGADFQHLDGERNSLLHIAAKLGNLQVLKFFLDLGLNVNHVNANGDSPLHHVIRFGKQADVCEKIRLLVENGANVGSLNNSGCTPLAMAMKREDRIEDLVTLFATMNLSLGYR